MTIINLTMNKQKILKLYTKIDSLQLTIDSIKASNLPKIVIKWGIWAGKTRQNTHLDEIKQLFEDKQ